MPFADMLLDGYDDETHSGVRSCAQNIVVPHEMHPLFSSVHPHLEWNDCMLMQASGCGLSLAGQTQTFSSCQVLSTSAAQFNLLWTLQAPTAAGQSVLHMAMDVPSNGGWVAVGFPTTPGEMVGASAVILKTDAASATGVLSCLLHPA